jgi:hypothetical protein
MGNQFIKFLTVSSLGVLGFLSPTYSSKAESIDSAPLNYRCTLSIDGRASLNTKCAAVGALEDISWSDKRMRFACHGIPGIGKCTSSELKITQQGNFGFLFSDGDGYTRLNWNQGSGAYAQNGFNDLKKSSAGCWETNKATWMYGNDKPHKVKFCIIGWQ